MMSALALSPLADAVAASLLPPAAQPAAAARLGLADLSLTPRHGCKGPGAAGWLAAVGVSFTGHHWLSFRGHGAPLLPAALRFLCISGGGFLVNEAAYAMLLHWTGARYDLLLAAVLVLVAGGTYLLSRHWAFLRS